MPILNINNHIIPSMFSTKIYVKLKKFCIYDLVCYRSRFSIRCGIRFLTLFLVKKQDLVLVKTYAFTDIYKFLMDLKGY